MNAPPRKLPDFKKFPELDHRTGLLKNDTTFQEKVMRHTCGWHYKIRTFNDGSIDGPEICCRCKKRIAHVLFDPPKTMRPINFAAPQLPQQIEPVDIAEKYIFKPAREIVAEIAENPPPAAELTEKQKCAIFTLSGFMKYEDGKMVSIRPVGIADDGNGKYIIAIAPAEN